VDICKYLLSDEGLEDVAEEHISSNIDRIREVTTRKKTQTEQRQVEPTASDAQMPHPSLSKRKFSTQDIVVLYETGMNHNNIAPLTMWEVPPSPTVEERKNELLKSKSSRRWKRSSLNGSIKLLEGAFQLKYNAYINAAEVSFAKAKLMDVENEKRPPV